MEEKTTAIIVKKELLLKTIIDVAQEYGQGVEISIRSEKNEETGRIERFLDFATLESGGFGIVNDYDSIPEMTETEILDIP